MCDTGSEAANCAEPTALGRNLVNHENACYATKVEVQSMAWITREDDWRALRSNVKQIGGESQS